MDSRGQIHMLARLANESELDARARLEKQLGKLMPIPAAELEAVKAMPTPERVAWFHARRTEERRGRKAARKAQRAARKKQRRAR